MILIFKVQPSIRLAERLLKGRPAKSKPGLIEKWCGQDLSSSFKRQLEFVGHVRHLLGFSVSEFAVWGSGGKIFAGPITKELLTFWWHCLRHSFISVCVSKGLTWEQIAEWVGHVSPETARLYTHFNLADSKQRMESLEIRF